MAAEFEVYQDSSRQWRWRLWSTGNWKIVSVSSESYDSAYNAERSAEWVKANAPTASVKRA